MKINMNTNRNEIFEWHQDKLLMTIENEKVEKKDKKVEKNDEGIKKWNSETLQYRTYGKELYHKNEHYSFRHTWLFPATPCPWFWPTFPPAPCPLWGPVKREFELGPWPWLIPDEIKPKQ